VGNILRSSISNYCKQNPTIFQFFSDYGPAHLLLQYLLYTIYFAEIMILPQILHFNYIFVMSFQFVNISCLSPRIHISKKGYECKWTWSYPTWHL